MKRCIVLGLLAVGMGSCSKEPKATSRWERLIQQLEPLHEPLGEPRPGEWLYTEKEPGQTYLQYRSSRPVRPIGRRNKIYVMPVDKMSAKNMEIVKKTARFLSVYFDTPVEVAEPNIFTSIPDQVQRKARDFGKQLYTGFVLNQVLPRAEKLVEKKGADGQIVKAPVRIFGLQDAAAVLGFTTWDLWTGADDNNFVFGQVDLERRVGVWSLARNGDPEKDFVQCLRRAIKAATHDTGLLFSMRHCTTHKCNMNGSMSREEFDRRPLALSPDCLAKVCWACTAVPYERFETLVKLCDDYGLIPERDFYRKSLSALPKPIPRKARPPKSAK